MIRAKRVCHPSAAREPPAGTRFKAGRRPAVEASLFNCVDVKIDIPKYKSVQLTRDNNINWPGSKEDPGSGL